MKKVFVLTVIPFSAAMKGNRTTPSAYLIQESNAEGFFMPLIALTQGMAEVIPVQSIRVDGRRAIHWRWHWR